jgi:hypothetical protein
MRHYNISAREIFLPNRIARQMFWIKAVVVAVGAVILVVGLLI